MLVSGNSDAGIVCLAQHAPQTVGRWPLEQPQAFHNQRPQAIAATGFQQPARAPRRAADRMDPAAMPRSSKAVRKAVRHALGDAEDCTMNDRT